MRAWVPKILPLKGHFKEAVLAMDQTLGALGLTVQKKYY